MEYITIDKEKLNEIIANHKHWLDRDVENWASMRADLRYADLIEADLKDITLRGADLSGADLSGADLSGVDLRGADLRNTRLNYTDLSWAELSYANLRNARLICANLSGSNLISADLSGANLRYANLNGAGLTGTNLTGANLIRANLSHSHLSGANLSGADLNGANLSGADLTDTKGDLIEYRKGKVIAEDIIGYKKCKNGVIVTLKIPKRSIVFSINGKKCRTNRAIVVDIDGADRAYSFFNKMSYYIGDEFNIYNFNCQYNLECASGIHFFMTREEAEMF